MKITIGEGLLALALSDLEWISILDRSISISRSLLQSFDLASALWLSVSADVSEHPTASLW